MRILTSGLVPGQGRVAGNLTRQKMASMDAATAPARSGGGTWELGLLVTDLQVNLLNYTCSVEHSSISTIGFIIFCCYSLVFPVRLPKS